MVIGSRILGIGTMILGLAFAEIGCGGKGAALAESAELCREFHIVGPEVSKKPETLNVIRRGRRMESVVLVAPATMRASLKGTAGAATLVVRVAPVFNIGDGIRMDIFIRRSGVRIWIGGCYFDPGKVAADRDWKLMTLPMETRADDELEIEASPGPQGESTADWLAIASVRLAR